MLNLRKIYKRKIGIFGNGNTGKKTKEALSLTYNKILIYDDKIKKLNKIVRCETKKLDFIIISPGVSKKHRIFKICEILNIPKYIDIDLLFFTAPKVNYLTITGTNGKSTNSILLYNTLKYNKIKCSIGGNIGFAVVNLKHYYNFHEYYIIELSSYQLEIIKNYKFKIRILLSIDSDHLNRYNSIQEYIEKKLNIIKKRKEKEICVISLKYEINKKVAVNIKKKYLNFDSKRIHKKLNAKNAHIRRLKNLENLLLVYKIMGKLIINEGKIVKQIKVSEKLKYRMVVLLKKRQLIFINNSKSTNIKSCNKAMNFFKNVHWILGGSLKEYSIEIITKNTSNIDHCYFIGKNYKKFLYFFMKKKINFSINYSLKKLILLSKEINKGSILLFPCCSSTDQWRSFEERGIYFTKIISIRYEKDL